MLVKDATSRSALSHRCAAPPRLRVTTRRAAAVPREQIAALDGVEPHAGYGDPVEELTLYSASLDLLVVGSRGYGPIGRLVHGSTSQRLARTTRWPLLVLTRSVPASSKGIELADQSERRAAAAS